jgi:hypothetical protein
LHLGVNSLLFRKKRRSKPRVFTPGDNFSLRGQLHPFTTGLRNVWKSDRNVKKTIFTLIRTILLGMMYRKYEDLISGASVVKIYEATYVCKGS